MECHEAKIGLTQKMRSTLEMVGQAYLLDSK